MSLLRNMTVVKILGRLKKRKEKHSHVLNDQKAAAANWSVDHWDTSGAVKLTELERVTGKTFEGTTPAMTISDFVKQKLSRMPNPGDEVIDNGLSFLVLNIKNFRVGDIQIRLVKTKSP